MTIVSSVIVSDSVQVDGRRAVRERHTDHIGLAVYVDYIAEAGDNVMSMLPIRAAQIDADAAASELDANEQEVLNGNL